MGAPSAFARPPSELRTRLARGSESPPLADSLEAATARAVDSALLALVLAPLRPGETALLGYARKERELRGAFSTLSLLEAHALRGRLEVCRSDDALALAFARLTVDRRTRLLTYLADARRRAAVASLER
jgi:hypothetical protein